MMSGLSRPIRIVLAGSISLLLLPCFGFGVFGFLASGEPGSGTLFFRIGYSFHLLLIGIGCVFLWKSALRRYPTDNLGGCMGCGYSLKATTEPRCPECGRPTDFSTGG
jgi:hypothetical protein